MNTIKTILLFVLFFSADTFGQSRDKIIEIMFDYSLNVGKSCNTHNFVDERLNPALDDLEKIVCQNNDRQLLENFLDMMLATSGSANEKPADILAGIFICRTNMVESLLRAKYKNAELLEMLDFGFANLTSGTDKPENYEELQLRLASLLK
jgi:Trp operon repressor